MDSNLTRRRFLEISAALLGVSIIGGCKSDATSGPQTSANPDGSITLTGVSTLKNGEGIPFLFPNGEPGLYFVTLAGQPSAVSAKCTHQGCVVLWNDSNTKVPLRCPCHESHFSLDGEVLGGPAKSPLPHYKVTKNGDKTTLRLA